MRLSFTVDKLRDCKDILDTGKSHGDGDYDVILGGQSARVLCDMKTDGGGWTVSLLFGRHFRKREYF